MNKYVILFALVGLLIAGGVVYKQFIQPKNQAPVTTGNVKSLTITAVKDEWRFAPETIDVTLGDRVNLTIVNEDSYDHGIGIDAFGISQRMPAKSTINVSFVVTKPGDFPFYCSVPCGEGVVSSKKRTHFDMIGTMHVKGSTTPTP